DPGTPAFLPPRVPPWLGNIGITLLIAALWPLGVLIEDQLNPYFYNILIIIGINIILAVSLNLINGVTGQFSLGHAGFMAVGAYTAAAFTKYAGPRLMLTPDMIYVSSLLLAALMAGVAGLLVGLPSLRLRGDYLAIVTLGFGQIIIAIIVTIKELGGALRLDDVASNAQGQLDVAFQQQIETTFLWVYALGALCILMMRNLADSSLGRSMRAVREDEVAAAAVGVNTTSTKVLAFVISSMWAGVAGGLYAHYRHFASPGDYDFVRSVEIVVMVVLGGLGSITGATLAAVVLKVMDEALRTMVGTFWVGVSLCLLAAALAFPRYRSTLRTSAVGWLLWLRWPALSLFGIWWLFRFHRDWIESPDSVGNAADWLRKVVYALILIILMLLRPQGLLGRAELGRGLFRRRRQANVRGEAGG
ncbi:MAG TPA: branched-chain amino acid ABC transporter permease, partial [Abditibacteriaceae bacterium]|nr:branched-chain amino acid ABC transporter permease [Abditibacteriaceae bacterium]